MSNGVSVTVPVEPVKDPSMETKETTTPDNKEEKLLAGRFKTQEELEKGYLNLLEASSKKPPVEEKKDLKIPEPSPKLNFDKYAEEFVKEGKLSEDSYKELETKGIPKQVIDAYTEGILLKQEKETARIVSVVGSEEEFKAMIEWASNNLKSEEINMYNKLIENSDSKVVQLAVSDLHSKYKAKTSAPPSKSVEGKPSGATNGNSYASHAEFMRDVHKPEYEKDPAFRAKVEEKLSRSKF